jgi:hypothetical protein
MMVQSTLGQALTEIEREIEAEVRNRPPLHEPRFTGTARQP